MKKILALLVFTFICVIAGSAQANGFDSIAVAGGIADPEGGDPTFYLHASARFKLSDNWAVDPELGYLDQDEAQETCLARGCIIFGLRDFSVGASVLYLGAIGKVQLFFGGGPSVHFRERKVTQDVVPPENPRDLDATRFGLQALYGVDIPVSQSFDITATVRKDWIWRGEDSDDLNDPEDVQGVFKLYGGIRFYFD